MRIFLAGAVIALLIVPVYAQGPGLGAANQPGQGDPHAAEQALKKKRFEEAEKAYTSRSQLDKLPDKKFDPWQNIRGNPQPK